MARRLGLPNRPRTMPQDVLEARVQALFNKQPAVTVKEVLASIRKDYCLGIYRAWAALRSCRETAARHSPAYKQMAWRFDGRTKTRIRVAAIWKRYPEITGKQVIKILGRKNAPGVRWVQMILKECWRASGKHSAKQRLIGRRMYSVWRRLPKTWRHARMDG
jgi:hypothetical protein